MFERQIIALVGGMCSGKDTWADFFENEFDYTKISTSDAVRDYIRRNNLGEPTRDNVRVIASEMRKLNGKDYLVESALSSNPYANLVFSGLYTVAEAQCIKKHGGVVVGINADDSVRFKRMAIRGRSGEYPSKKEYVRLANSDLRSVDTDQTLEAVLQIVDYSIDGNVPITNTELCRNMAMRVLQIFNRQQEGLHV
jgi:hypothetical protein